MLLVEAVLRRTGASPDVRLERFQAVLRAAAATSYYRPLLEAAELAEPWQASGVAGLEETLGRLPPTDLTTWLLKRRQFVSRSARRSERAPLFFPGPRPGRAALLRRWHRAGGPGLTGRLLKWFPPDVLAGPARCLHRMAEAQHNRRWDPLHVNLALVAWIGPDHGFLSEATRELLWRTFQVPVFAQLVGPAGEVLAWECEAHDGLHMEASRGVCEFSSGELLVTSLVSLRRPALRLRTGLTAAVAEEPCPCGVSSPRLVELRRWVRSATRVATAAASAAAD